VLTLVLGGAASGKSSIAEAIIAKAGTDVIYVATGVVTDDDMATRIAAHRARRPDTWSTVETGDLPSAVAALPDRPALIDSIGTWVAHTPDFAVDVEALVSALASRRATTVVVSDEVGLGVHPETEVGRRFRDAMGHANRRIGDVATEVLFVVAGRVVTL
jgi:adenosyl cobinamide kinase/adenosyl cobinamide phosphate guanylyltransferase